MCAIVRAWRLALAAAYRANSNPARCRVSDKYNVSPSLRWDIVSIFVSLGEALYPYMLHLTEF